MHAPTVNYTSDCENSAKLLPGILMYDSNAVLFHLPRGLIVESSNPLAFVVVAAPMRKLWPVQPVQSRPASVSAR